MNAYDSELYALSVEPREAAPGDVVRLNFRAPNLGGASIDDAVVRFLASSELELLDADSVPVGAVAPGDAIEASVRASVPHGLDDGSVLAAQALLEVGGRTIGTNTAGVRVRSRAVLDGPASSAWVESVDDDIVRVYAVVVNEGDGPARDVEIVVQPPWGTQSTDPHAFGLRVERFGPGERVELGYDARIVAPIAALRIEDALVRGPHGTLCAIAARDELRLQPKIAPPQVSLTTSRRRLDVAIDVCNAGWADACDVHVGVGLPPPLRLVPGSVAVDGVVLAEPGRARATQRRGLARIERSADGFTLVLASVAARSSVRVAVCAAVPPDCRDAMIRTAVDRHVVELAFVPEPRREVRMRLVGAPHRAAPGETVTLRADVLNAGDVTEHLTIMAGDATAETLAPRAIAPGELVSALVPVTLDLHADGTDVRLAVIARDDGGERARAETTVRVRDPHARAASELDQPEGVAAPTTDALPAIHGIVHAPAAAIAGVPFALSLGLEVPVACDTLAIRVPSVDGATYVAGSTVLDGLRLVDRHGRSPLADGLIVRAIPAGTRLRVGWSLIAESSGDTALTIRADAVADGERCCAEAELSVQRGDVVAVRPRGVAFYLEDAVAIAAQPPSAEAASEPAPPADTIPCAPRADEAFTFALDVDGARLDDALRLLRGSDARGLAAHLLVLRAMFPDRETSGDRDVADALAALYAALRDVFDRLFVKLRIPGFLPAAEDLEDGTLRVAAGALFARLLDAQPGGDVGSGPTARIDRERIAAAVVTLDTAPYGAPAALRTLLALVPNRDDEDPLLGAALRRYLERLDDVLARNERAPLEVFDNLLAQGRDVELEDARAALIAALRLRTTFAGSVR